MRIVNVMISKMNGGVEQAFLDYNAALQISGHQILSIVDNKTRIKSSLENVQYITINFWPYNYLLVWKLIKEIKKFQAEIIITHSKKIIPILRIIANWLQIPLIGVAHNDKYKKINKSDAIFSITEYQKDIFIQKGYPKERIYVIPNMIKGNLEYKEKLWHNPPIIGSMGRFDPVKGFDTYLKALALLHKEGIEFAAILGGSVQKAYPQEKEKLEQIIIDNQLERCVNLCGWVTDKKQFFQDIDIFVLPSNYEPFGIVLLEAMQYSTPIVTSDAEGPKEIFGKNKDCVYVFEKGNVEDLANKLRQALKNREETNQKAKKSWQLCEKEYNITQVSEKIDKMIQKVIIQNGKEI